MEQLTSGSISNNYDKIWIDLVSNCAKNVQAGHPSIRKYPISAVSHLSRDCVALDAAPVNAAAARRFAYRLLGQHENTLRYTCRYPEIAGGENVDIC